MNYGKKKTAKKKYVNVPTPAPRPKRGDMNERFTKSPYIAKDGFMVFTGNYSSDK